MSKTKSDALQALVTESVELDREIDGARAVEEEARLASVAARQILDQRVNERSRLEDRKVATTEALGIVQRRDDVSDEVVAALVERARR